MVSKVGSHLAALGFRNPASELECGREVAPATQWLHSRSAHSIPEDSVAQAEPVSRVSYLMHLAVNQLLTDSFFFVLKREPPPSPDIVDRYLES